MTYLFAWFTKTGNLRFPGAPFVMGALLLFISALLAYRTMSREYAINHK
jgi:MFS transporter, DHA1 family, tetracycline resistance protein